MAAAAAAAAAEQQQQQQQSAQQQQQQQQQQRQRKRGGGGAAAAAAAVVLLSVPRGGSCAGAAPVVTADARARRVVSAQRARRFARAIRNPLAPRRRISKGTAPAMDAAGGHRRRHRRRRRPCGFCSRFRGRARRLSATLRAMARAARSRALGVSLLLVEDERQMTRAAALDAAVLPCRARSSSRWAPRMRRGGP